MSVASHVAGVQPADPPWRQSIAAHADALDEARAPFDLTATLAGQGLTRIGVPRQWGGDGAPAAAVVQAIAGLAEESLTAAFVLWGHRCYIEYLVHSDNPGLRERTLPDLLAGRWAGATGMSNAMKYLGGIEPLQVTATALDDGGGWRIDGKLPWVTHLRRSGFSLAAAAQPQGGGPVPVFAFHSDQPGVRRSDDLPLIGLRGSDTAAVQLHGVHATAEHRLHADLKAWLPVIRPSFLAYQCGMSIGLARAGLRAAQQRSGGRGVLAPRIAELQEQLDADTAALHAGLDQGRFGSDAAALFRLRIALAGHVQQAVTLELQASGGRAYLEGESPGFARRWRESAFIPVITPSLSQLQAQLRQHAAGAA